MSKLSLISAALWVSLSLLFFWKGAGEQKLGENWVTLSSGWCFGHLSSTKGHLSPCPCARGPSCLLELEIFVSPTCPAAMGLPKGGDTPAGGLCPLQARPSPLCPAAQCPWEMPGTAQEIPAALCCLHPGPCPGCSHPSCTIPVSHKSANPSFPCLGSSPETPKGLLRSGSA